MVVISIALYSLVYSAQEDFISSSKIPDSITKNCLLTPHKTIEHCPSYRQALRAYNRQIAAERMNTLEGSGWLVVLQSSLQKTISAMDKAKLDLIRATPNTAEIFMSDYKLYLHQLFLTYSKYYQNNLQRLVPSFFEITYYDDDHAGLGISQSKLYNTIPAQYDDEIVAQFDIRNYSTETIDTIENLYCFTTMWSIDYIFPIAVTSAFNKNSLTSVIASIDVHNSPLLDTTGVKKLYCTLVYQFEGSDRYTNRSILEFIMRQ